MSGKGNHFEPVIVDALMDLCEQGEIFEPLASSRSTRKVSDEEVKEPC